MVRAVMLAVAMLMAAPSLAWAQQREVSGLWTGSIEWRDGARTPDANVTFHEDGTFSAGDRYTGVWTQYDNHVIWIISVGARSVYEMDVEGDTMTGTVRNRQGMSGRVIMRRAGSGQRR